MCVWERLQEREVGLGRKHICWQTLHEMVTIERKIGQGMPSCGNRVSNCGVSTMIQGIAWLQNAFIPASGLRLYYIAGDRKTPATLTCTIEYPWPTSESLLWKYSGNIPYISNSLKNFTPFLRVCQIAMSLSMNTGQTNKKSISARSHDLTLSSVHFIVSKSCETKIDQKTLKTKTSFPLVHLKKIYSARRIFCMQNRKAGCP